MDEKMQFYVRQRKEKRPMQCNLYLQEEITGPIQFPAEPLQQSNFVVVNLPYILLEEEIVEIGGSR